MEKSVFLSRTIYGAVIALVGQLMHLGADDVAQLTDLAGQTIDAVSTLITIAGAVYAIYGRVKATKQVKLR